MTVLTSQDVNHPIFARLYERVSAKEDERGGNRYRAELLNGASGDVIEVGAGNGRNFAHYPTIVSQVVAVEPEPRLRASAMRAAASAPVPIEVVAGVADRLPAQDGAFDVGVVASLPWHPDAIRRCARTPGRSTTHVVLRIRVMKDACPLL